MCQHWGKCEVNLNINGNISSKFGAYNEFCKKTKLNCIDLYFYITHFRYTVHVCVYILNNDYAKEYVTYILVKGRYKCVC